MRIPDPFGFPDPVNEKAARAVAAGVLVVTLAAVLTGWLWLSPPLALGCGFILSLIATVSLVAGAPLVTVIALLLIAVAAFLESVLAICLGCVLFGWLMRAGVIRPETCAACDAVGAELRVS